MSKPEPYTLKDLVALNPITSDQVVLAVAEAMLQRLEDAFGPDRWIPSHVKVDLEDNLATVLATYFTERGIDLEDEAKVHSA